MRKSEIDRLLETAVARALHVELPRQHTRLVRRPVAHRPIKHAA